jgi:hypothetical protein
MHGLVALLLVVAQTPRIDVVKTPEGGLQPQVATDAEGVLHVLFFQGDPLGGDLFHTTSSDGGASFSAPLRVNHDDGDAVAIGNVRGAHLAIGRDGAAASGKPRVHVAWMGSAQAKQRAPDRSAGMLYARLAADGLRFEPERNVIAAHPGLDGGGSLAADGAGRVWVAWHAPRKPEGGESDRCIWVAASTDDGATFGEERAAWNEPTGACGCCGMRAGWDGDALFVLYRAAREGNHRDLYALVSNDHGATFRGARLDEWTIDRCVMSTAALQAAPAPSPAAKTMLAAWEDEGDVAWARLDPKEPGAARTIRPPARDAAKLERKHPALAQDGAGRVLLAWTEGMGWEHGGAVAWQLFDRDGRAVDGASGRRDGVPAWSLVAVAARNDGSFVIFQ